MVLLSISNKISIILLKRPRTLLLHAFKLTVHYVPITGNYSELLRATLNKLQTRILLPVTVNAGFQSETFAMSLVVGTVTLDKFFSKYFLFSQSVSL
jgi:hypothetical protein